MENEEVFQQDLSQEERPGGVFSIKLLFRESIPAPDRETMTAVLDRHIGNVECGWYEEKSAGFAAKNYLAKFKEGSAPPLVTTFHSSEFDGSKVDDFQRRQMWDCRDHDRILAECKYCVFASDMLAATLPAKERAALDMDMLEAMLELYPTCEAVLVHSSGKMLLPEAIRNYQGGKEDRFIRFAVNARLFNVQGGNDLLVDTVGMSTLFLPDLQYHFHGMDPNWVVRHAYGVAAYILNNDNPIKSGDPIDSVVDGRFNQEILWKCHYEDAMVQPARAVIDIYMNEYASGQRNNL